MPGYGASRETHTIYLEEFDGSDNWVKIRAGRTSAAATRISVAPLRVTGVDSITGTPTISERVDLTHARRVLFEESIVEWSLTENGGEGEAPMPLTSRIFDGLDAGVAEFLDRRITAFYQATALTTAQVGESNGRSSAP